jgi:hypothetical protein
MHLVHVARLRREFMFLTLETLNIFVFFGRERSHRHSIEADDRLYIRRTPVSMGGNAENLYYTEQSPRDDTSVGQCSIDQGV